MIKPELSLAETLSRLTKRGELFEEVDSNTVQCFACAHNCHIREGKKGVCRVRFHEKGELRVPAGYVSSIQVDPIEKKPFYHFLAGSDALTFGMLGCNFHCNFCQNWLTSQALREEASERLREYLRRMTADEIVQYGHTYHAEVVASSYNEPLITSEWAKEIFQKAVTVGLKPVYVSNGFATTEVLDYLQPYLQGFKVDLKTMQDSHYRGLGGRLEPVLESICYAHQVGMWVEVVTLVIPGFNDSDQELREMAQFLASISPYIPWHVSAFRPQYKMTDRSRTPPSTLLRAVAIGADEGLQYVYAGNLPGGVGEAEHTKCHHCQTRLIERTGYRIRSYQIKADGTCPACGERIPGVWTSAPDQVRLAGPGYPRVI